MRRLWGEVDLHVVAMLVLLTPAACLGWLWLAVPLLVPQGRIGTRAFADYAAFGHQWWAYLAANEVVVFGLVGGVAGLRFALGSVA